MTPITVEAVYEDGVLRLAQPLPLAPQQRVTITVDVTEDPREWPEDVAAIYQEIAEEDRRLANLMFQTVRETWPRDEDRP